jgi:drug/metabolite transporter (DMT)-like permease
MQMFGLQGVSPPVSAFLTSLYVVFTALMTTVRTRRPVGGALLVGTLLATFGAGFIGGPPQLAFGPAEGLTVGCAFVFAVHILVTDAVTRRHDPLALTFVSILTVALGSAVLAGSGLVGEAAAPWSLAVELALDREFLVPMLCSSLLATVLALSLMNLFQREVDPVRAAILYAVEPVWASLIALVLGLARADAWLWIGGAALLTGNLAAELGPRARRRLGRGPATKGDSRGAAG